MYYLYILYSERYDRYYVGQTNDLDRRLDEHNHALKNSYTSRYRPWELMKYFEVGESLGLARKIENYVKGQKSRADEFSYLCRNFCNLLSVISYPAMKLISTLFVLFSILVNSTGQDIIATSRYPEATANHNQRKIVRDSEENIFVVYADSLEGSLFIKGVYLNRMTMEWSDPVAITEGTHPTLALTEDDQIYLVYQSLDSVSQVKMIKTDDFSTWSDPEILSNVIFPCTLPVADCDAEGRLNVLWLQHNSDSTVSVIYCNIYEEEMVTSTIDNKNQISDISIANHLSYANSILYFGYQYNGDSLQFFSMEDNLSSLDTLFTSTGSQPGLTINSNEENSPLFNFIRGVFIDTLLNVVEWEQAEEEEEAFGERIIIDDPVTYLCVDDLVPPIGYSYLLMKNDSLFHGFSFGFVWDAVIHDTIAGNAIFPSIAYKHFNIEYIDIVWMQESDNGFTIHYQREEKYQYIFKSNEGKKTGRLSVTGYPNPFTHELHIQIVTSPGDAIPVIDIYDINSKLVTSLAPERISGTTCLYTWNTSSSSEQIPPGLYLIRCTAGRSRTVKKVIKAANW